MSASRKTTVRRLDIPIKTVGAEDTFLLRDDLIRICVGHGETELLYVVRHLLQMSDMSVSDVAAPREPFGRSADLTSRKTLSWPPYFTALWKSKLVIPMASPTELRAICMCRV